MNPHYYPAHFPVTADPPTYTFGNAFEGTTTPDRRPEIAAGPPPPYSPAASLHNNHAVSPAPQSPLMAMTVSTDIMGRHVFKPIPFPCGCSFINFQHYWQQEWFKLCREQMLHPGKCETFIWTSTIMFQSGSTMSLAADTWPVFQEYVRMEMEMEAGSGEDGPFTGMTLQVKISTSKRARRLCKESCNWSEGTRLLHGMYVPALTLGLEREKAAQEKERAAKCASASGSSGWRKGLFAFGGWFPRKANKPVKPLRDEPKVAKVWSRVV